jgi:hypothetical protein
MDAPITELRTLAQEAHDGRTELSLGELSAVWEFIESLENEDTPALEEFDIPAVGDTVYEPKNGAPVTVVGQDGFAGTAAHPHSPKETLADFWNCDEQTPLVQVMFPDGNAEYSYPVTELEQ